MSLKAKKSTTPSRYDADFKAALPALERAAKRARENARRSKTPLAVWQDGRIKTVSPDTRERKGRKA